MKKPIFIGSNVKNNKTLNAFKRLTVYLSKRHIYEGSTTKYYIPRLKDLIVMDNTLFFNILYTDPVTDISYRINSSDPAVKVDFDYSIGKISSSSDLLISPCCIVLTTGESNEEIYDLHVVCRGYLSCKVDDLNKKLVIDANKDMNFLYEKNSTEDIQNGPDYAIRYINGLDTSSGSLNIIGKGDVTVSIMNKIDK